MTEPGGDAYKGARNGANQAHGKGMLKLLSGETYDGGFKNDKMDGIGKHKWKSGAEYEGEWSEDTRHGIGTYKFPDKSIFVGRFKKNLRETIKGTYTWANGEIYEGGFKGDKLEGNQIEKVTKKLEVVKGIAAVVAAAADAGSGREEEPFAEPLTPRQP